MVVPSIPEEVVDRVVERVAGFDDDAMRMEMRRSGPFQPELTGFVIAFTHDCGDIGRSLATVGMLAAYDAFRVGYVKTRKARERLVLRKWEEAADFVAELAEQFHGPQHLTDDDLLSSQPAVMAALMARAFSREGDSSIAVPVDDAWQLLSVFMTIVETLHECAGAPRFPLDAGPTEEPADLLIGLAWYTPEQWERMRETAEDEEDELDDRYEDWLATATTTESHLRAEGIQVTRVMIQVDEMLAWFAERGRKNTGASRSVYALELRRAAVDS